MKTYETYKDSGIEWLGQIPGHWEVEKLKYLTSCNDDVLSENTPEDKEIKYVEIGDVDSVTGINGYTLYKFKEDPSRARRITKVGDIIISTVRTYLKAIASVKESDLIVSTGFAVLRPQKIASRFLAYAVLCKGFIDDVIAYSTGVSYPAINASDLVQLRIPVPPISEQEVIASYLDYKIGQVDLLIAEKEKQMKDLQQYRMSLISETVTHGLNPDVKMKESGVEWLGRIPEHWEVLKMKYLVTLQSGSNLTAEQIQKEGQYPVYGGNGIRGYYHSYSNDGEFVLIGRQGALCGNINYATGKFWATEHAVICYPIQKFALTWFGELLRTMNLNQYSESAAQPGLSVENIKKLLIPVPPLSEQQSIASFLDDKTARIDSTLKELEMQIADLRCYKTSVITEAVTGKVDVRQWKQT